MMWRGVARAVLLGVLCGGAVAARAEPVFVLLTNRAAPDAAALGRALDGVLGPGVARGVEADAAGAHLEVSGCRVRVVPEARPLPWELLAPACAYPWWWTNATQVARSHSAHLVVTLSGGDLGPVDRALVLTRVALAACRAWDGTGVLWAPGPALTEPDRLARMLGTATPALPPLPAWICFWRRRETNGGLTVATTGLGHFGWREVEVVGSARAPREVLALVQAVGVLQLGGARVADGDFVGPDGGRRLRVWHRPSVLPGRTNLVLRVEF